MEKYLKNSDLFLETLVFKDNRGHCTQQTFPVYYFSGKKIIIDGSINQINFVSKYKKDICSFNASLKNSHLGSLAKTEYSVFEIRKLFQAITNINTYYSTYVGLQVNLVIRSAVEWWVSLIEQQIFPLDEEKLLKVASFRILFMEQLRVQLYSNFNREMIIDCTNPYLREAMRKSDLDIDLPTNNSLFMNNREVRINNPESQSELLYGNHCDVCETTIIDAIYHECLKKNYDKDPQSVSFDYHGSDCYFDTKRLKAYQQLIDDIINDPNISYALYQDGINLPIDLRIYKDVISFQCARSINFIFLLKTAVNSLGETDLEHDNNKTSKLN